MCRYILEPIAFSLHEYPVRKKCHHEDYLSDTSMQCTDNLWCNWFVQVVSKTFALEHYKLWFHAYCIYM